MGTWQVTLSGEEWELGLFSIVEAAMILID